MVRMTFVIVSQLIAHNSQLNGCLEDANINSRGLSSLRFYCIYIKKASGRRF